MSIIRYAQFAVLALASSCVIPSSSVPNFPGQEAAQAVGKAEPGWRTNAPTTGGSQEQGPTMAGAEQANVPLYARDGSIVHSVSGGATKEEDVFSHEMEPTSTGRMYILELYQDSLDEVDALEAELANLGTDYSGLEGRLENTRAELANAVALASANREEADGLFTENSDLAARLTTAQIRRLEAERMLLEAKLELLQLTERSDGPTASTSTKPHLSSPVGAPPSVPASGGASDPKLSDSGGL